MKKTKKTLFSMMIIQILLISACSQTMEIPRQNLPSGKCGGGFCGNVERARNSCPMDCSQEMPDDANQKKMPSEPTANKPLPPLGGSGLAKL